MHAFTNIKKGVRFVLFDHSVEGYDSWPEQCGVCRPQSSVIVRIRPQAVPVRQPDCAFQEVGPSARPPQ